MRACMRAYSSRVKRHSVLRRAGKSRGRLYANFYTTDFTSRGALVCPFVSLPSQPSEVFYGLHIRNPGIMQVYYSLRRRNPAAASADAFLGLVVRWRIWCSQYDMPALLTLANVLRHRRDRICFLPHVATKLITRLVIKTRPLVTKTDKNLSFRYFLINKIN